QNYPNPFNPQTIIPYDVARASAVRLSLYALTGQRIRTLVEGERFPGSYSVVWNGKDAVGRDVASGVYLCRMVAGRFTATRKLVLIR
ncbi:MAG: T9SS type A sorting domain-containing protein, partial [candidate division Zixibacteria bacterium]|nr:T9SS type A sorting domain-containing protein [candidate division Zixibacteria bacterium]